VSPRGRPPLELGRGRARHLGSNTALPLVLRQPRHLEVALLRHGSLHLVPALALMLHRETVMLLGVRHPVTLVRYSDKRFLGVGLNRALSPVDSSLNVSA